MQVRVEPSGSDWGAPVHNPVEHVENVCPADVGKVPMSPSWSGVLVD